MSTSYPRLSASDVRDFVDGVVRQGVTDDAVRGFFIRKQFPAVTPQESEIVTLVDELVKSCADYTDQNAEVFEAEFSPGVYLLLENFADTALGDEGFWSYLSVRFFWRFVAIRQKSAWLAAQGQPRNPDQPESERQKLERYLIGKDHYQLPLRMYLRAQSVMGPDGDCSLASVPGTDFWRSQILGVRTSVYPSLARSVVKEQETKNLNVEQQRPPGRMVNRLRANIEFACHEESEVRPLVSPIWIPSELPKTTKKTVSAKTKTIPKKASPKKIAPKRATSKTAASKKVTPKKKPSK